MLQLSWKKDMWSTHTALSNDRRKVILASHWEKVQTGPPIAVPYAMSGLVHTASQIGSLVLVVVHHLIELFAGEDCFERNGLPWEFTILVNKHTTFSLRRLLPESRFLLRHQQA